MPLLSASPPSPLGLFDQGAPENTGPFPMETPKSLPRDSVAEKPSARSAISSDSPAKPETNHAEAEGPVSPVEAPCKQSSNQDLSPAEALFATVRESMLRLLKTPMKDADIAAVLDVSTAQARAWLQRLVNDGALEKRKKPAGYIAKQKQLFE
jgi:DNA processing protein